MNQNCRDTMHLVSGDSQVITFLYETSTTIVFNICDDATNAKSEVRKRDVESVKFKNGEEQFYKGYYKKYPDVKKPKTPAQKVGLAMLVFIGLGAVAIGGFFIWLYTVF